MTIRLSIPPPFPYYSLTLSFLLESRVPSSQRQPSLWGHRPSHQMSWTLLCPMTERNPLHILQYPTKVLSLRFAWKGEDLTVVLSEQILFMKSHFSSTKTFSFPWNRCEPRVVKPFLISSLKGIACSL